MDSNGAEEKWVSESILGRNHFLFSKTPGGGQGSWCLRSFALPQSEGRQARLGTQASRQGLGWVVGVVVLAEGA